jgi:hypothetical protein
MLSSYIMHHALQGKTIMIILRCNDFGATVEDKTTNLHRRERSWQQTDSAKRDKHRAKRAANKHQRDGATLGI